MSAGLGIGGSPRRNGNWDTLLDNVLQGARDAGTATETIQLREHSVQSCIGCERCRRDLRCTGPQDDMQVIYPKLEQCKGPVAVSPLHGYTVSALMKAFLDRLYCHYDFAEPRPGPVASGLAGQERKAVIVVVGEQDTYELGGMESTLVILRRNLDTLCFEIVFELPVLGAFERGHVLKQPEVLAAAEEWGATLAHAV